MRSERARGTRTQCALEKIYGSNLPSQRTRSQRTSEFKLHPCKGFACRTGNSIGNSTLADDAHPMRVRKYHRKCSPTLSIVSATWSAVQCFALNAQTTRTARIDEAARSTRGPEPTGEQPNCPNCRIS